MFKINDIVHCVKRGKTARSGKIVEITLFRRDNSIGYGIKPKFGTRTVFYVPESDIKEKK